MMFFDRIRPRMAFAALSLAFLCGAAGGCATEAKDGLPLRMAPRALHLAEERIEIRLDLRQGVPVVTTRDPEGQRVRWLLDSGARYASVTQDLAARLLAKPAPLRVIELIGQEERPAETVLLPDLQLGRLAIEPQIALVEPDPEVLKHFAVDGILGMNAFRGAVLRFDFPAHTLSLVRGPLSDAPAGLRCDFAWEDDAFRPRLSLSLEWPDGGHESFVAIVDTGSNGGLRLPRRFTASAALGPVLGRITDRTLYGTQEWELIALEPVLRLGPFTVEGLLAGRYLEGPEIAPKEQGLLGMLLLGKTILSLDFEARRGRIELPSD